MRRSFDRPAVWGPVVGAAAFVFGYLVTLGVTVVGERATLVDRNNPEAAGWLYYNSQLANVVTVGGRGGWTDAFTGQEFNLLTQVLWNDPVTPGQLIDQGQFLSGTVPPITYHIIPIAVLFTAGFLFARLGRVRTVRDAIAASGSIAVGTTVAAGVGTVLFTVRTDALVIRPDPLEGVLMAGLFFPMVASMVGCIVATEA